MFLFLRAPTISFLLASCLRGRQPVWVRKVIAMSSCRDCCVAALKHSKSTFFCVQSPAPASSFPALHRTEGLSRDPPRRLLRAPKAGARNRLTHGRFERQTLCCSAAKRDIHLSMKLLFFQLFAAHWLTKNYLLGNVCRLFGCHGINNQFNNAEQTRHI